MFIAYSPIESFLCPQGSDFIYKGKKIYTSTPLNHLWKLGFQSFLFVSERVTGGLCNENDLKCALEFADSVRKAAAETFSCLEERCRITLHREYGKTFQLNGNTLKPYLLNDCNLDQALALIHKILVQNHANIPEESKPVSSDTWLWLAHLARLITIDHTICCITIDDQDSALCFMQEANDFITDAERAIFLREAESAKGRKGATKRHLETSRLKQEAIDFWIENIDPNLSAEKAASIIIRQVPISQRKAAEYIREAKKVRTAGKV